MGSKSKQHRWGNPDEHGARACNNQGCTVRVKDAFREWQPKKGRLWQMQHRELIPECTGSGPIITPTPEGPDTGKEKSNG